MKLWTSCFWTHMTVPNTVSIAWRTPAFYKGPRYAKLAPPGSLVKAYKDGMEWEVYEAIYSGEVLSKLTPAILEADLLDGTVLLCWERTGNCHRHIVAHWARDKGIECAEVTFED